MANISLQAKGLAGHIEYTIFQTTRDELVGHVVSTPRERKNFIKSDRQLQGELGRGWGGEESQWINERTKRRR